jgi:UDP-GlcNAc:undecaprenyl-phosphate GlcNAc-1-phosphate transferase
VAVGAYDDIYEMSPGKKLAWQVVAAIIVVGFGVGVGTITNPFGGLIHLDNWRLSLGFLGLESIVPLADLAALIWIVIVINVVNWLDGLDGLAAGVSGIAALALFALALMPIVNQPAVALIAIILVGSIAGFIPYNFFPAKIFMGDSGSMFLGYSLAVFSIISGGKIATAFLVLGFPILDAIWVISRRIINNQPIWKADRKHLHHRLLDLGLSQRKVVISIYILAAIFGVIAVLSGSMGKLVTVIVLAAIMVVLGTGLVVIEWRRKQAIPK